MVARGCVAWARERTQNLPLLTFPSKQVAEHLAQVGEVWFVIKAQRAAVLKVCNKLHRVALAQYLGRRPAAEREAAALGGWRVTGKL